MYQFCLKIYNNNNKLHLYSALYKCFKAHTILYYYYYPGHWIHRILPAHEVHSLHSLGSIPASAAIQGRTHANQTHKPPHPTGYPFIHLGGEQQCGLNVLLRDISARLGNRTHDPQIESRTTNPLGHNTS